MFKYLPLTPADQKAMLETIKVASVDDLLVDIPETIRLRKPYKLLPRLSESQLRATLKGAGGTALKIFRGYGAYEHERPAIIDALASRQEFLTSYTPYQPEVAQGTLQYIFEFQSMITQLTGMDVSNASMYDGTTALAEATMMAVAHTTVRRIIVASPLHSHVLKVLQTYCHHRQVELIVLNPKLGCIDRSALQQSLKQPAAAVIVSYPNAFGLIDLFDDVAALAHAQKALLISYVDPFALAALKSPRELGADIACGEAQSLGIPLSFGGPYLGFLNATMDLVRRMPGRICGMTKDNRGQRGFVLTLQTREQHIRREKANSNICSNQSLMALQATIYLSTLGKKGLKEAFSNAASASHYLANELVKTGHFKYAFHTSFAYEATLTFSKNAYALDQALVQKGYLGGQPIDDHTLVFYASEMKTKTDIDAFVSAVKEATHGIQ